MRNLLFISFFTISSAFAWEPIEKISGHKFKDIVILTHDKNLVTKIDWKKTCKNLDKIDALSLDEFMAFRKVQYRLGLNNALRWLGQDYVLGEKKSIKNSVKRLNKHQKDFDDSKALYLDFKKKNKETGERTKSSMMIIKGFCTLNAEVEKNQKNRK